MKKACVVWAALFFRLMVASANAQPAATRPDVTATATTAADVEMLGAFSVLGSTKSGKTLFVKQPDAHTAEAAITQAADALAKALDSKLSVSGAVLDARTKTRGWATFSAKVKGQGPGGWSPFGAKVKDQDLRGWMFFSLGKDAALVSVVYAPADAPQTELSSLFAALPAGAKMREHRFPDGSGSVDLPPGWTTETPSLGLPLIIKGPAGQAILINYRQVITTPDGKLMQLARQNYQMAVAARDRQAQMQAQMQANRQQWAANNQRMGFPPPPPLQLPPLPPLPPPPDAERDFPQLIFCHYCPTPEEEMKDLEPILQARAKRISGIEFKIDRVIETTPAAPNPGIAGAQAAVFYLAGTKTEGATVTHTRSIRRVECCPLVDGKDAWMVFTNSMGGPDETFDGDRPVMKDIMDSVKIDPEWFARKQQADSAAILKMGKDFGDMLFRRGQEFNRQQTEHFNHFEAQMHAQYQARHDANSDFIEMIRGVRDVYDTKTGTTHSVDLYNSNAIVNGMNAAVNDPNQYVQIPLRYER